MVKKTAKKSQVTGKARATKPAAKPAKKTAKPGATRSVAKKYVYFFGNGKAEGDRHMKDLLGGKGSGLAEMTNAGLPVPPGLTISTEACTLYYDGGRRTPAAVDDQMIAALRRLEQTAGA